MGIFAYLIRTVLISIFVVIFGCNKNGTEPEPEPIELLLIPSHVSAYSSSDGAIDLTVSGGIEPYEYQWSTGATTEDISNLTVGVYSVTVTDSDDQTETESVEIFKQDSLSVIDFDGNFYRIVKIGDQWWMAENLKTTHAADGTPLNGVYAYNDDENNVEEYGRLYTWESAINASPEGWHLPSNEEWNELISTLGPNAADELKEGGSSGFDAKMAGHLSGGSYGYIGTFGAFWTSTESGDGTHAMRKLIIANESDIITDNELMNCGLSVRCIKD